MARCNNCCLLTTVIISTSCCECLRMFRSPLTMERSTAPHKNFSRERPSVFADKHSLIVTSCIRVIWNFLIPDNFKHLMDLNRVVLYNFSMPPGENRCFFAAAPQACHVIVHVLGSKWKANHEINFVEGLFAVITNVAAAWIDSTAVNVAWN